MPFWSMLYRRALADPPVARRTGRATSTSLGAAVAEGARYASKRDWRRAARACCEAVALRPHEPRGVLQPRWSTAQRCKPYLEVKERTCRWA